MHDGSGDLVDASATADGVVFEASGPDVFTVSAASGRILVVANVADPHYAQINRSRFNENGEFVAQRNEFAGGLDTELWVFLLVLSCVFFTC